MRIEVTGSPAVCVDRLRAYAEYRVFARLAPVANRVKAVRITVRRLTDAGATSCVVVADLGPGGTTRTRTRSMQPSRAIDVAATRLAAAVLKRLDRDVHRVLTIGGES